MKTTIELPDPLFRHVKMLAARQGTTMRMLVIEGLQQLLQRRGQSQVASFALTPEESEIATIGASGMPVLKRTSGAKKKVVTNEFVKRLRDELSI